MRKTSRPAAPQARMLIWRKVRIPSLPSLPNQSWALAALSYRRRPALKNTGQFLKKYDVLFIADEVICGFGRTGNMWGCQTFDLQPDMITCAKALSSAYLPISAVFDQREGRRRYRRQRQRDRNIGTWLYLYGTPVAAAVALETLKMYERDMGRITRVARMQQHLASYSSHPLVGEVRGVGLVGALELVKNKATKEPFNRLVRLVPIWLTVRKTMNNKTSSELRGIFTAADHLVQRTRFRLRSFR